MRQPEQNGHLPHPNSSTPCSANSRGDIMAWWTLLVGVVVWWQHVPTTGKRIAGLVWLFGYHYTKPYSTKPQKSGVRKDLVVFGPNSDDMVFRGVSSPKHCCDRTWRAFLIDLVFSCGAGRQQWRFSGRQVASQQQSCMMMSSTRRQAGFPIGMPSRTLQWHYSVFA